MIWDEQSVFALHGPLWLHAHVNGASSGTTSAAHNVYLCQHNESSQLLLTLQSGSFDFPHREFTGDVQRSPYQRDVKISSDPNMLQNQNTYGKRPIKFPGGLYLHTIIFDGWLKIVPAPQLAMAHATCLLLFHTTWMQIGEHE